MIKKRLKRALGVAIPLAILVIGMVLCQDLVQVKMRFSSS